MGPTEPGRPEPDPDFEAQFAQLVKEVEEGRRPVGTPPRDDAAAKPAEGRAKPERGSRTRRVWPRNLAIVVIAGALAAGAFETTRHNGRHEAPTAAPGDATAAPGDATAAPSAVTAAPSDDVTASPAPSLSQIPVSRLFPQTVHGTNGTTYTLVIAGPLNSCTNSDMVGTTLEGMFAQSSGCLGGEGALYKDAAKDQFNMTVFTLKDPADVISIMTQLSMDPEDFEVGALQPPAGSGLTALSATSGIIQQFQSAGHYMGVFMAQWSDGRVADYGSLQQLLNPLQNAVFATMKNES